VSVLLEERVDSGNSSVPRVTQVFECQSLVLLRGLLTLHRILGPDSLGIDELLLPWKNVTVEIGNQLILFVTHSGTEVSGSDIGLFGVSQIGLRNENVSHGKHSQTSQLLGSVEDHRRESAGHLRVETDLDSSLNLVLALDEKVQQLLCVDSCLSEVGHEPNQRSVPLVDDLGEGGGSRSHEDHSDSVLKLLQRVIIHSQVRLCRPLLGSLVLQIPHSVLGGHELFVQGSDLGQDSDFEASHAEQKIRVVLAVNRHETAFPLDSGDASRQSVLDVPEHGSSQVDVVFHESHSRISGPTLLVVVANDVLIVGIGMLGEISLDELLGLLVGESIHDVDGLDVSGIQTNGVLRLHLDVVVGQKVVRQIWRSSHLGSSLQSKNQDVQDETIVLDDEGRELETSNQSIRVDVVHVLVVEHDVVLGRHVVSNVMIDDESQQSIEKSEIHLLVDLLELGLHDDDAFSVGSLPDSLQVVDALAPLVDEKWRRLVVAGLDPVGEQPSLVGFVPEVLIQVGISDLLERLHVIDRCL